MTIGYEDYRVVDLEGNTITYLNYHLGLNQKITKDQLDNLKKLHIKRHNTIFEMKGLNTKDHLRSLAKEITDIDFELQENWNFKKDITFHRFWELPFCTCPKIDNAERVGTSYTIISSDCPIHGD